MNAVLFVVILIVLYAAAKRKTYQRAESHFIFKRETKNQRAESHFIFKRLSSTDDTNYPI